MGAMDYHVILKPAAEKDLARLSLQMQRRVVKRLAQVQADPRHFGAVKLAGSTATFRSRVGDWRIVYEIDDSHRIVFVTIIAHRREVYRNR